MKKSVVYGLVCALIIASTAHAVSAKDTVDDQSQDHARIGIAIQATTTIGVKGDSTATSSSRMTPSDSPEKNKDMVKGKVNTMDAKMNDHRTFPGIVTSVATSSFQMTGRGNGNASTTITVNTTASTTFKNGSTTGLITTLTAGTKVEVKGMYATSTNTITAEHVMFGSPKMEGDALYAMRASTTASSTIDQNKGFFHGFTKFFKSIFGWMK